MCVCVYVRVCVSVCIVWNESSCSVWQQYPRFRVELNLSLVMKPRASPFRKARPSEGKSCANPADPFHDDLPLYHNSHSLAFRERREGRWWSLGEGRPRTVPQGNDKLRRGEKKKEKETRSAGGGGDVTVREKTTL